MALTATVHRWSVVLSDVDRSTYESLEMRLARHPSESARYLLTRTLAYCLSYEEGIAFSKKWIDVAASVGSPSVRTNMPPAKDSKPDVDRAADTLLRVAEYGAAKNIVVNLENDNPVSEDPFFIVSVLEKVNNPWLHSNPDFANTLTTGRTEYSYKGIEAMFKHAYSICHVKAMEADEKGQLVHTDMARTFAILKASNYKGYCSMEFDSPGDPYQGTSDLIDQTLKFLS